MASELERQVLIMTQGDPSRLRAAIQAAHDQGMEIAPPQDAIFAAFEEVLRKPGSNVLSATQEVTRGHAYASKLEGEALAASNEFFADLIREYFL